VVGPARRAGGCGDGGFDHCARHRIGRKIAAGAALFQPVSERPCAGDGLVIRQAGEVIGQGVMGWHRLAIDLDQALMDS
jgi:hypothetical protein